MSRVSYELSCQVYSFQGFSIPVVSVNAKRWLYSYKIKLECVMSHRQMFKLLRHSVMNDAKHVSL